MKKYTPKDIANGVITAHAGDPETSQSEWELVLTNLPFVRHKHLWDDSVWEPLEEIAKSGTRTQCHAAMVYLTVREDYFYALEGEGYNLRHVNNWQISASQAVYNRVAIRLQSESKKKLPVPLTLN